MMHTYTYVYDACIDDAAFCHRGRDRCWTNSRSWIYDEQVVKPKTAILSLLKKWSHFVRNRAFVKCE